jgi:hypothetical protein
VWERFDRTLLQGWVSASEIPLRKLRLYPTSISRLDGRRNTTNRHCGLTSGERQTPDQFYRFNQIGAPNLDAQQNNPYREILSAARSCGNQLILRMHGISVRFLRDKNNRFSHEFQLLFHEGMT